MLKKKLFFAIIILFVSLNLKAGQVGFDNLQRDSSELNMKKFNEGVDFYAIGNEPFWNLDLAINQFIHFNELDGMTINLGSVKGEKAMDANVTRYVSQTDKGMFSMTMSGQECFDNMSGDTFTYKVIVELNNPGDNNYKKFEGCGRYVPDYNLNRTWTLKSIGGDEVTDSIYPRGLPSITFDIENNRFSGSGGCNRIMGFVTAEESRLRFSKVASTMMACPKLDKEREFLSALERTMNYKIIGNQLTLADMDSVLMVLYDPTMEIIEKYPYGIPLTVDSRLNDIWVLETINDSKADAKNYMKGLPVIEFHINDMTFMGNGGCNEYNGKFEVNGDKIKFGQIASTRMACPGNYESDFFAAFSNANNFKIENNRLNLTQDGKTLIIFKKVD